MRPGTAPTATRRQRGAVLLGLVFLIFVSLAYLLFAGASSAGAINHKNQVTADALAKAKDALIAWSATNPDASHSPGRLPCPEDTTKIGGLYEGDAAGDCGRLYVGSLPAVGRLPWRTLDIGDLRDGNGDRLWYVVSPGFRTPPINSDTPAQLTLDGVPNAAVAIVFSPGPPLPGQNRPPPTSSQPPRVADYLDLENGNGNNVFVSTGPAGSFNDRLLAVSHADLFRSVERRVAASVLGELQNYYNTNGFYPGPAQFNDKGCLGTSRIDGGKCRNAGPPLNVGRIPANLQNVPKDWPADSLLTGALYSPPDSDWFQRNGWRELTYYAVAPACIEGTSNCSGSPLLTVDGAADKRVAVIVAGQALPTESRSSQDDKRHETNYLEDQNLPSSPQVFVSRPSSPSVPFNDVTSAR